MKFYKALLFLALIAFALTENESRPSDPEQLEDRATKIANEWKRIMNAFSQRDKSLPQLIKYVKGKDIDWTSTFFGKLPPRAQGKCGSCWALNLATLCEIGAALYNYQNPDDQYEIPPMAVQPILEIDKSNKGCQGGEIYMSSMNAQEYGCFTEYDAPYLWKDTRNRPIGKESKYVDKQLYKDKWYVKFNSEASISLTISNDNRNKAMDLALTYGPFATYSSLPLTASPTRFNYYEDKKCAKESDHVIIIVGLVHIEGKKYYKARNSYGSDWGFEGYFYVPYEKAPECALGEVIVMYGTPIFNPNYKMGSNWGKLEVDIYSGGGATLQTDLESRYNSDIEVDETLSFEEQYEQFLAIRKAKQEKAKAEIERKRQEYMEKNKAAMEQKKKEEEELNRQIEEFKRKLNGHPVVNKKGPIPKEEKIEEKIEKNEEEKPKRPKRGLFDDIFG